MSRLPDRLRVIEKMAGKQGYMEMLYGKSLKKYYVTSIHNQFYSILDVSPILNNNGDQITVLQVLQINNSIFLNLELTKI